MERCKGPHAFRFDVRTGKTECKWCDAQKWEPITPVLFRVGKERPAAHRCVTAVFPTLPSDTAGRYMTCYSHVGQHSGCSWEWYHITRAATTEEYKDLQAELEQIGYKLKVFKRISSAMRAEFRRALTRRD